MVAPMAAPRGLADRSSRPVDDWVMAALALAAPVARSTLLEAGPVTAAQPAPAVVRCSTAARQGLAASASVAVQAAPVETG
jgi:hypothetical protein